MGEGPYEKGKVLSKENEGRVFFFLNLAQLG